MVKLRTLVVRVNGRPAPQGSKRMGEHGQMLEQSPYLHAWRGQWKGTGGRRRYEHGAVGRAVYEAYAAAGVLPEDLPLFPGPAAVSIVFHVETDPAKPPDIDKLARSTFDALTVCRVWDDDGCAVRVYLEKASADADNPPGATIVVRPYRSWKNAVLQAAARRRVHRLSRRYSS